MSATLPGHLAEFVAQAAGARVFRLSFPGLRPQSKRRPRVTARGTYNEPQYREWRNAFAILAALQWRQLGQWQPLAGELGCWIEWTTTTGRTRGDGDNNTGAVWDGLQDAGVVADDKAFAGFGGIRRRGSKAECGLEVWLWTLNEVGPGSASPAARRTCASCGATVTPRAG